MTSRSDAFLQTYPVGQVVRIADISGWKAEIVPKIRDRMGEVAGHQAYSLNPIVTFPAIGRRSVFNKVFSNPLSDLVIVRDAAEIAAWREEVEATAARAAKRQAKARAKPTATSR